MYKPIIVVPNRPVIGASSLVAGNAAYLAQVNQYLSSTSTPVFQSVAVGTITIGGQLYQFPVHDGRVGQALVTNGAGVLTWSTPQTSASSTSSLTSPVSLYRIDDTANAIVMSNSGASLVAVANAALTVSVPLVMNSGVQYSVRSVYDTSYSMTSRDTIINWMCSTSGTIYLPSASTVPGIMYIIQHRSTPGVRIELVPAAGDAIMAQSASEFMSDPEDVLHLVSDGINNWIT